MLPSPWVGLVLALAAFRLTRLASYDDFPPIAKARAWLVAVRGQATGPHASLMGLTDEEPTIVWTYGRPLTAALLGCVYCIGFWISLAVYGGWLAAGSPGATVRESILFYLLVPFALAAAVGIIARRLDP